MRRVFVWIHRYVGLAMALFLIIEGVTGSLLAFRGDLTAFLDPRLVAARPSPEARRLDLATLAEQAEALMPNATAAYFFRLRDDQVIVRMAPRRRSSRAGETCYPEDPGVIVLDPWTGKELGRMPYSGYTQASSPTSCLSSTICTPPWRWARKAHGFWRSSRSSGRSIVSPAFT